MLLKQRNIVVRPDNADKAELEMKKLEHFGWVRVCDNPNEDGSVVISYVRDEDECADKVESEQAYRSAKVASAYASATAERLTYIRDNSPIRKKGVTSAIIFGIVALLFIALAVVPLVWQTVFCDYIFTGDAAAQLGGDWTFFGFTRFNFQNSGLPVLALLFTCVFSFFAIFFATMAMFVFKKNQAKTFDDYDDEVAISNKIAYLEEVKAAADADIASIYPDEN